jgi:hypothetical protein
LQIRISSLRKRNRIRKARILKKSLGKIMTDKKELQTKIFHPFWKKQEENEINKSKRTEEREEE